MDWIIDLFAVCKLIIAMCHLLALPGDPAYDLGRAYPDWGAGTGPPFTSSFPSRTPCAPPPTWGGEQVGWSFV
jgi:hypothetical protein